MSSRFPTLRINPLKGLNLEDDKYRLKTGESTQADNVFVNDDGSIERMGGVTNVLASSLGADYCTSLYEHERWDGTIDVLFSYNTNIRILDDSGNTSTVVKGGMTNNAPIRFCTYNDFAYGGNGFDSNIKLLPDYRHKLNRTNITTTVATNTATLMTLAEAIRTDYVAHIASTTEHNIADTDNVITAGTATDITTAIVLVSELVVDYDAHRVESGIHPSDDDYHNYEAASATDAATAYVACNQLKVVYNQHISDGRISYWDITAPTAAVDAVTSSASGMDEGVYKYIYTYYDSVNGFESPPSDPVTFTLATATTGTVDLGTVTAFQISTDPQATHKRIYRTLVDGAVYYKVADITNVTTTYVDTAVDSSLGAVIPMENCSAIPNTNIHTVFNERIYMAGDVAAVYRMYFTEPYYPWRYKAALNYMDFDVKVTGIAKTPNGLIVFEEHKTWFLAGTSPRNFSRLRLHDSVGCTNPEGYCYGEKGEVYFISHFGVYVTNGTEVQHISREIDSDLLSRSLDSATLVYDHKNRRLYVCYANV